MRFTLLDLSLPLLVAVGFFRLGLASHKTAIERWSSILSNAARAVSPDAGREVGKRLSMTCQRKGSRSSQNRGYCRVEDGREH